MLPWNYGFHLDAGHVLFLGAFYLVLAAVTGTLLCAAFRSRLDLRSRQIERIRWQSQFNDLPARDRVCRHVLTGELHNRCCPHAFDCRECSIHAQLLGAAGASRQTPAASAEDVLGMAFPLDRMYHRGHTWVHLEDDGTVTVGLDELANRLLANPEQVSLPPRGSLMESNGPAFHVLKNGARVRVLSPVDGRVVETGGPGAPWYLRIRPAATGEYAFRHLLRGSEIHPWLMRELERLQLTLGATLADGGTPVADLSQAYPRADWDNVCAEMFLEA